MYIEMAHGWYTVAELKTILEEAMNRDKAFKDALSADKEQRLTDNDFRLLQQVIVQELARLEVLQQKHIRETGKRFVHGQKIAEVTND